MDSQFLLTERENWRNFAENLLVELGINPYEHINSKIKTSPEIFTSFITQLSNHVYTQDISFQKYISSENALYSPYIGTIFFKENLSFKGLILFIERTYDEYFHSLFDWKAFQYFFNYNSQLQIILENGFPKLEYRNGKLYVYAVWDKFSTDTVRKSLNKLRYRFLVYKDFSTEEALQIFLSKNYGILNKSIITNNLVAEVV